MMFNRKDPITVVNFLTEFADVCDQEKVFEGNEMWILQFFSRDPVRTAL